MTLSPALPQEHLFEALQESAQPGQYARQYLEQGQERLNQAFDCLLYTSPSPRD